MIWKKRKMRIKEENVLLMEVLNIFGHYEYYEVVKRQ